MAGHVGKIDETDPNYKGKVEAQRIVADLRKERGFADVDRFFGNPLRYAEHLLGEGDYWMEVDYMEHLSWWSTTLDDLPEEAWNQRRDD